MQFFGNILALFDVLAEQRYAARASNALLQTHRQVRAERPDMQGCALYEAIVARHTGVNAASARQIVRRAEQSLADWPVERDVMFRDIVHYVTFEDYVRRRKVRSGTLSNIGKAVARAIPEDL